MRDELPQTSFLTAFTTFLVCEGSRPALKTEGCPLRIFQILVTSVRHPQKCLEKLHSSAEGRVGKVEASVRLDSTQELHAALLAAREVNNTSTIPEGFMEISQGKSPWARIPSPEAGFLVNIYNVWLLKCASSSNNCISSNSSTLQDKVFDHHSKFLLQRYMGIH